MKSRTEHESFEDKRKYPRLIMRSLVKLQYQAGGYVDAKLHDISPDGIQLRCDRDSARLIHPSGEQIKGQQKPRVSVTFNLIQNDDSSRIIVSCSICYFAALTDGSNEMAFGLQFRKFEGDSLRLIKRFFLSEMEPY